MKSPSAWKFLTDAMFGKLGIYLRLLGFDVEIAPNTLTDPEVFQLAQKDQRILITRDKGFYQRVKNKMLLEGVDENVNLPAAIFIDEKRIIPQIAGVFRQFNLDPALLSCKSPDELASRCTKCNSPLISVEKESIQEFIQPGTYQHFDHFWRCTNPTCNAIYWIGKDWVEIEHIFSEVQKEILNN